MNLEKIIHGVVFVLKQQCLQCEYRNQWKAQVDEGLSATEEQHALTGGGYVSSGSKQVGFEHPDRKLVLIFDCSLGVVQQLKKGNLMPRCVIQ